jgi:hypothetical protein
MLLDLFARPVLRYNSRTGMNMEALPEDPELLGDMDGETFHRSAMGIARWIRGYLNSPEDHPVLARVAPGDVTAALPADAPERGEPMERILADFQRILVPALTHWNHPGFLGYFPSSGSGPGVLAEFLTAAVNQQAMLWRTSPAATELEAVTLGWLRRLLGLPASFEGVTYDGGSASNLHALMAAREADRDARGEGVGPAPRLPGSCPGGVMMVSAVLDRLSGRARLPSRCRWPSRIADIEACNRRRNIGNRHRTRRRHGRFRCAPGIRPDRLPGGDT